VRDRFDPVDHRSDWNDFAAKGRKICRGGSSVFFNDEFCRPQVQSLLFKIPNDLIFK